MSMRSIALTALTVVSCIAIPVRSAHAQMESLIPGVRVRIRAPGSVSGRLTGTVLTRTSDSLSIATESGVPLHLPLSRLTAVEVSRGKSRSMGAMKGALWGAGVGALSILLAGSEDENCTTDCLSRGEVAFQVITGGVMVGAGVGAFVGSESWDRLDVPVRTALLRTRGGPTAVVSIRF